MAVRALPDDAPTPSVVPTEEGGVDLVWHKGGWGIELEIDREGTALLWMHERATGGDGCSVPLEEGLARLCQILGELARRPLSRHADR